MDGYYSVGVQPPLGYGVERHISSVADIMRSVGKGVFLGCLAVSVAATILFTLSITQSNFLLALNGWTAPATTASINAVPASPAPLPEPLKSLPPAPAVKVSTPGEDAATNKALNDVIADFVASHKGTFTVATSELDGVEGIFGGHELNKQMPTASTYKMFLGYIALQRVEQGKLSMSAPVDGHSLDYCIQQMILVSDNDCAQAIGSAIGLQNVDRQLHKDGFTKTTLNVASGIPLSSAGDEAALMAKLSRGQLVNTEHTNYLIDLMKRQIFRGGIPAGSVGAQVADKVGFIDTVNNDEAIVYAPKATYSLVVMTDNAAPTAIRDLSQQIYNFYIQHASQ